MSTPVASNKELQQLVQAVDFTKVEDSAANHGIRSCFNPPAASHFNGVHEAIVKSAKRALLHQLSNADITDEELITAVTSAEALLNGRPLTYQSAHPEDDGPLHPNQFIIGRVDGLFLPPSVDTTTFHLGNRWRHVQQIVKHFWQRWMRELLPQLNLRAK